MMLGAVLTVDVWDEEKSVGERAALLSSQTDEWHVVCVVSLPPPLISTSPHILCCTHRLPLPTADAANRATQSRLGQLCNEPFGEVGRHRGE
jgi:hypothetical protein